MDLHLTKATLVSFIFWKWIGYSLQAPRIMKKVATKYDLNLLIIFLLTCVFLNLQEMGARRKASLQPLNIRTSIFWFRQSSLPNNTNIHLTLYLWILDKWTTKKTCVYCITLTTHIFLFVRGRSIIQSVDRFPILMYELDWTVLSDFGKVVLRPWGVWVKTTACTNLPVDFHPPCSSIHYFIKPIIVRIRHWNPGLYRKLLYDNLLI